MCSKIPGTPIRGRWTGPATGRREGCWRRSTEGHPLAELSIQERSFRGQQSRLLMVPRVATLPDAGRAYTIQVLPGRRPDLMRCTIGYIPDGSIRPPQTAVDNRPVNRLRLGYYNDRLSSVFGNRRQEADLTTRGLASHTGCRASCVLRGDHLSSGPTTILWRSSIRLHTGIRTWSTRLCRRRWFLRWQAPVWGPRRAWLGLEAGRKGISRK